jgi:hypothetical protein
METPQQSRLHHGSIKAALKSHPVAAETSLKAAPGGQVFEEIQQ